MPPLPLSVPSPRGRQRFLTSPPQRTLKELSPSPQGEGERKRQNFFKETNTQQQLQWAGVVRARPPLLKKVENL